MSAGARASVENFAREHGLRAEWQGEIGFGRECVGLLDPDRRCYVRWTDGCQPATVPDAYHKGDYIAVLGRGERAEQQLREWCRHLAKVEAEFVYLEKEMPDLATLAYGYTDELTAVSRQQRNDHSASRRSDVLEREAPHLIAPASESDAGEERGRSV